VRVASASKLLIVLAVTTQASRHGAPIDYFGLAAASAASWLGIPGPGESVLIAAGVLAAKHRLDLSTVLLVAWIAATAGGIAGWLIGRIAGRTVMTARGPLLRLRLGAVKRGDEVFTRYPVVAILLTPSWIAGIHRGSTVVYLVINAVSAVAWALGIGLAAYFVGPSVIEFVSDLGVVATVGLAALVGVVIVVEIFRRRRRLARDAEPGDPSCPADPAPVHPDPGPADPATRVHPEPAPGTDRL
jgi:membrane protein DedA with SNARE-associated domain